MSPWSTLPPVAPPPLLADLAHISPIIVVFAAALLILVLGAILRRRCMSWLPLVALGGILGSAIAARLAFTGHIAVMSGFSGMVSFDPLSGFLLQVLLTCTAFVVVISPRYLRVMDIQVPEYYALLLFALCGTLLMAVATDFVLLFVALEILTLSSYVLAALNRGDPRSVEAGIKYFVLGAFSSAILLYGVALVYGASGGTGFESLARVLASNTTIPPLLAAGLALVMAGFAFKIAAAPFHFWVPDVYQGAPTPVTAFLATASKVAGFGALLRLSSVALAPRIDLFTPTFAVLAALSLGVGSVGALIQTDLKRMLAYSSIAHAGFMLLGMAGLPSQPGALPFYLVAYPILSLGAFAVVTGMATDPEVPRISHLAGLGRRSPRMAGALAVCLLGLAGLPGTIGFMGKLQLLLAAVDAGRHTLAGVGMLAAVVGGVYYIRPVLSMVSGQTGEVVPRLDRGGVAALGAAVIVGVWLGVWPGPLMAWCAGLVAPGP